jgi:glycerophosphoryl diester phosphodiesterase
MYEIAHRGDSDLYKDNTIDGFKSAIEKKFDIIELDITLTKDNYIIIYHDTFIDDRLIKNMNLKEVKEKDKDIILLTEFFDVITTNKTNIYLDVKGDDFICVFLHKILMNLNDLSNIIIGSFNTLILKSLYNLNNNYTLGLITENVLEPEILNYYINSYNIAFVSFHWTVLDHKIIRFLNLKNVLVFSYTCKNDNIKKFMDNYTLDGIITNYKLKV